MARRMVWESKGSSPWKAPWRHKSQPSGKATRALGHRQRIIGIQQGDNRSLNRIKNKGY